MFRHSSSASSAASYGSDVSFMNHSPAAALPAVPTQIPRVAGGYLDGNASGGLPHFGGAVSSSSSSPPSYSSSLPSSYYNNIQRSISSHSLPHHLQLTDHFGGAFFSSSSSSSHQLPLPPPLSSSPSSSSGDLFEFTSPCPVRRVFSTGDLQGMNGSSPPRPLPSGESCGQDGSGPFSQKVGRYSAEERKERIERYRVKRHQRNFNKKITYACRKTLADSRPRVKGRFARNGEADAEGDEREAFDASYSYDYSAAGYSDYRSGSNSSSVNSCYNYNRKDGAATAASVVGGSDNGEWWWRAPGATTAEAERQRQAGFDVDEEIWATLGDMLSVNLAS
ncbi:zinc finger protein CONSTANS-LIKE 9-like [Oryza glaberrima]|uniref:CCT domain-containing protein n=1 Tax=Oryza glaberrima TaxID=4538 RepID=I1NT30_ORYGL|nr:zinc finger protein CONSTANS-LIKE 9-like [Oryza glaberrima]XP_052163911.1 zinc finger protein CONSTANS-LIKE 9-like [Oryza glaberrima]